MAPQQFDFYGNKVRFVMLDEKKYAVGKDAAEAIGYKDAGRAVRTHVKDKYRRVGRITLPLGGEQEMTLISEPGLYQLAAQSKLPKAEPFQDWLFETVLPQINETGKYDGKVQKELPHDYLSALKQLVASTEANQKLAADNEAMKPKAIFADAVATSKTSILVGELAKLLKQNGIDIGQKRLFAWMRNRGYLIRRRGNDWNTPTQRSMNLGLFKVKETAINRSDGSVMISKTTKVTGKGQQYFINKFINEAAKANNDIILLADKIRKN